MSEYTVAIVGPSGCGKTHFYTLLAYHLQRKYGGTVKRAEIKGYVKDVQGRAISFHELLAMLSHGMKLPPTLPPKKEEGPYKLYIRFEVPGIFRNRVINIPLIDISGEIVGQIMGLISDVRRGIIRSDEFRTRMEALGYKEEDLEILYKGVFGADVYIYVINTYQMTRLCEEKIDECVRLGASYSNFIMNLRTFRERVMKRKEPKAHAVVFTHFDRSKHHIGTLTSIAYSDDYRMIASWLNNYMVRRFGMDITGVKFTDENVFLSFTEEQQDQQRFRLILDESTGLTDLVYPKQEYDRLLEWLIRALS